ncbi:MAG TPA: MarR family winged helix-turn-helix transcriptional regulator [Myxococcota bacterium]|nr:MarR family winged helix-turn-helix transcriptional regulator [Myxococcota bacterium]
MSRARSAPRYTPGGAALHQLVHELERIAQEGVAFGRVSSARLALLHAVLQREQTASELARERGATRQATLRLVDALLAEGWLERVENPRHRRAPLLRATPLGARAYHDAAQLRAQALNRAAESCDAGEVLAAVRLLRVLREQAGRRSADSSRPGSGV